MNFPSFSVIAWDTICACSTYDCVYRRRQNKRAFLWGRREKGRSREMLLNSALLIIVCTKFNSQPPTPLSLPTQPASRYTFVNCYEIRHGKKSIITNASNVGNMLRLMFELQIKRFQTKRRNYFLNKKRNLISSGGARRLRRFSRDSKSWLAGDFDLEERN